MFLTPWRPAVKPIVGSRAFPDAPDPSLAHLTSVTIHAGVTGIRGRLRPWRGRLAAFRDAQKRGRKAACVATCVRRGNRASRSLATRLAKPGLTPRRERQSTILGSMIRERPPSRQPQALRECRRGQVAAQSLHPMPGVLMSLRRMPHGVPGFRWLAVRIRIPRAPPRWTSCSSLERVGWGAIVRHEHCDNLLGRHAPLNPFLARRASKLGRSWELFEVAHGICVTQGLRPVEGL